MVAAFPLVHEVAHRKSHLLSIWSHQSRLWHQKQHSNKGSYSRTFDKSTLLNALWGILLHQIFSRAGEFCPTRWLPEGEKEFGKPNDDALLAFGGGPRVCIGKYFAIMEGQVIASRVLRKARVETVPGFTPEVTLKVTLTSGNGIRLRAVPRQSTNAV